MEYPKEFADRIRAAFPQGARVNLWLSSGDPALGAMLALTQSSENPGLFTGAQLVDAVERGTDSPSYQAAKRNEQISRLYDEWYDLFQQQRGRPIRMAREETPLVKANVQPAR